MATTKKQLTVKPEFNDFLQAVDEYTAQLPLVIRMPFRQALHCEYEGAYEKMEELCRGILAGHPENTEALALLGRAQLSQQKYKEAEETLREGYSVRQLEERAAAKKSTAASKTKASAHRGDLSAELRGLEDEMRETLGLRVTIAGSERKGRIILQYHTAAELEALYEAIQRLREG